MSARVIRRICAALCCATALFFVLAAPASAATFSGAIPAPNSTITSATASASLSVADSAAISNTCVARIDGRAASATAAWAQTAPGWWEYDPYQDDDVWNPPTYDYTHAVVTWPLGTLTDGSHTASLTLAAGPGTRAYSWSFSVSEPPKLGAFSPAEGSVTTSLTPLVTISATDNSAVTSWTVTVDGVPTAAAYDAGAARLSFRPATLSNPATHTVSVTVRDALGNTAARTWHFATNAPVTVWSGETPTPGAVYSYGCGPVQVNAACSVPLVPWTMRVVVDGQPYWSYFTNPPAATGHWATQQEWSDDDEAWYNVQVWVPDPNLLCATVESGGGADMRQDGTHTVSVSLGNNAGTTAIDTWSFRVAIPPDAANPVPTDGSFITTRAPVITVDATDNTMIASAVATINGSPASATYDPATGKVSVTSSGPLPNDATTTVSVSVFDGCGLSDSVTWSFYVQALPDMTSLVGDCTSCHPGVVGSLDMGTDCARCHPNVHPGDASTLHPRATIPGCDNCHATEVSIEHSKWLDSTGAQMTCLTCHLSTDPTVVNAIATKNTACSACHGPVGASHVASVDHTATIPPQTITILGTDVGVHSCSECHSMSLTQTHQTNGQTVCATCHSWPRRSFQTWNHTCVQGACHSVESSAPMHAQIDSVHTIDSHGCTADGCHRGYDNIAAIHSEVSTTVAGVTRQGCQICHAAGMTPTADCTNCHVLSNAHGEADAARHTTTLTTQWMVILPQHDDLTPAGAYADCNMCHSPILIKQHGMDCQLCHSSTDPLVVAAIAARDIRCTACHPNFHSTMGVGHTQAVRDYECSYCHSYVGYAHTDSAIATSAWCGRCHAVGATDTVPPVTNASPTGTLVGPTTIRLTATDDSGPRGVKNTYYVLDGGPRMQASSLLATAPPSGSRTHTLQFWSVDYGNNSEATKSVTFTVFADVTPPVTTSDATATYYASVTIHLTAHDDATEASGAVAATYYTVDGSAPATGTAILVPAPVSGSATHTVTFWSVDRSGNIESPHTVTFSILPDLVPPVTSVNLGRYVNSSLVDVRFTSLDPQPGSGTAYVRAASPDLASVGVPASVDATTWVSHVSIGSQQGTHTIQFSGVDFAGNIEATKSASFFVDWMAPTVANDAQATYTGTAFIHLTPSDGSGSGVAATYWKLDSGAWSLWATGTPIAVSAPATGSVTHKLYAYAVDNAGNAGSTTYVQATFTVSAPSGDLTPPSGTMSISGGATYAASTTVTLTSAMSDASGVSTMAVDPTGTGLGYVTVTYAPSYTFVLPAGDGVKTVLARYEDSAGNWTDPYSDTIVLDTTGPSGSATLDGGAASTTSLNATVAVAASDTWSGVSQMRVDMTGTGGAYAAWRAYASSISATFAPVPGGKTVLVQVRDGAGNVSTLSSAITLALPSDTNPPTGVMSINNDSVNVSTRNVSVDSTVTDDTWGVAQMRIDPGSGTYGSWMPYVQVSAITLPSGDGTKTVRAQYQDYSGNTLTLTDAVALHEVLPTATLVFRWHPGLYSFSDLHVEDVSGHVIASASLEDVMALDWSVKVPCGRYKMVCDDIYIDPTGEEGGPFSTWVDATTPNATYTWWYY